MRVSRRPGSGGPSNSSSIRTGISMTPLRRPMSVAGGAAGRPRRIAWTRFEPSTSNRSIPSSGFAATVRAGMGGAYRRYPSAVLLLVDLDGVVYRGADPVPGVAALLSERVAAGDDVVYVTNNSMFYRSAYVPRLAGMGAPVVEDRVVTSARATALYFRDHEPSVRRVLVVGASGLEREMRDVGLEVTPAAHADRKSGV